ncbi:mechanosensitive ion channel family protein [bacterium]|nr:MAG: mechanosensitive ion channel family protein [bacterium]
MTRRSIEEESIGSGLCPSYRTFNERKRGGTLGLMRAWIEAGVVLGVFLIIAAAISMVGERFIRPWLRSHSESGWTVLVQPLRVLVVWVLVLMGINGAEIRLQEILINEGYWPLIQRAMGLAWVVLAVYGGVRILNAIFAVRERTSLSESTDFQKQRDARDRIAFSRKLSTGLVMAIGVVYALRVLGVDTSPLLAGGAVGGVIIGLALQDSLSNVFAGLFLNIDRPVRVGEMISLGPDKEGTVEEIGWRYTKIRLNSNNMLIVPNKTFASTEITNYDRPEEPTAASVDVRVPLDADLDLVERVSIEAANKTQEQVNNPPVESEPNVRFRSFNDSSITVRVNVQSSTPIGRFRLTSELIRNLQAAYREAGIVIPYPTTRSLVYSDMNANAENGAADQTSESI